MSTVSVHIVTFNSDKDIVGCLTAVLRQSYPVDQVIVIDNASQDRTLELIRPFTDSILIVSNNENKGFAGAHNQAIDQSICDYHLILNPDVILHPDYLHILMKFAEEHPKAGGLTGLLLSKTGLGVVDSAGLIMRKNRRAFDRGQGENASGYMLPCEVFGVSAAAALYSSRMVKEISEAGQFFDEAFFAYKEDIDVAWRARWTGWKAYFVPGATALHERGWKSGARLEKPLVTRSHSFENRYRMLIKNDKASKVLLHLPYIIAFEIIQFLYIVGKERDLLPSYCRVIRSFSGLFKQRRQIFHKVKARSDEIYSFFK
ncbi:MAG: glycosyltransferase family 2 protein [Gorillibacterium sp.]|nr:glycosyltransferase family 2 protein [Gorillibacterium sp.]